MGRSVPPSPPRCFNRYHTKLVHRAESLTNQSFTNVFCCAVCVLTLESASVLNFSRVGHSLRRAHIHGVRLAVILQFVVCVEQLCT